MERIGYLREVRLGGRIGRIRPIEVKPYGYKVGVKAREYKR